MEVESYFLVGDLVKKVTGDYHLDGTVVGKFEPVPNIVRYAVRHDVGQGWFIHIYSAKNLRLREEH